LSNGPVADALSSSVSMMPPPYPTAGKPSEKQLSAKGMNRQQKQRGVPAGGGIADVEWEVANLPAATEGFGSTEYAHPALGTVTAPGIQASVNELYPLLSSSSFSSSDQSARANTVTSSLTDSTSSVGSANQQQVTTPSTHHSQQPSSDSSSSDHRDKRARKQPPQTTQNPTGTYTQSTPLSFKLMMTAVPCGLFGQDSTAIQDPTGFQTSGGGSDGCGTTHSEVNDGWIFPVRTDPNIVDLHRSDVHAIAAAAVPVYDEDEHRNASVGLQSHRSSGIPAVLGRDSSHGALPAIIRTSKRRTNKDHRATSSGGPVTPTRQTVATAAGLSSAMLATATDHQLLEPLARVQDSNVVANFSDDRTQGTPLGANNGSSTSNLSSPASDLSTGTIAWLASGILNNSPNSQ
jgi:hypothetical protein